MSFWEDSPGDVATEREPRPEPTTRRGRRAERRAARKAARERPGYGAALVVVLLVGALAGGAWWFAHRQAVGRVASGTTLAGVRLGGGTRAQAEADLRSGLAGREDAPIVLDVGGQRVQVTPASAGLSVDYAASVDRVTLPDTWDPTRLWDFYTGRDDVAPVLTIDRVRLRREATRLASRFARPSQDAAVTFTGGQVQIDRGSDGQGLDVGAVGRALVHAYLAGGTHDGTHDGAVGGTADGGSGGDPTEVPLTSVAPVVDDQAVRSAIRTIVDPAVAAPVTLDFGGHDVRLLPADFHDDLTLTPSGGGLVLGVDETALMRLVAAATQVRAPLDATVALVDGAPTVVPPRRGVTYQPATVARVFLALLGRDAADRHAVVPSVDSPATFTARDARGLRIRERVATAVTHFPTGRGDATELVRQAALVDGTVLKPGQTFSLARLSPPTGATGSSPGSPGSTGRTGDTAETQLATTLYDAAFDAGLQDVEHAAPLVHVARLPLGREATVLRGGPDLRFRNDTAYGVLVSARVRAGTLSVTLWSTPTWDVTSATSCARSPGSSADEVVTSRIFRKPGRTAVDHIEKSYTTFATLPAAVCRTAGA